MYMIKILWNCSKGPLTVTVAFSHILAKIMNLQAQLHFSIFSLNADEGWAHDELIISCYRSNEKLIIIHDSSNKSE